MNFSGLGFFLNGTLLSNNSIALLSDIGEGTRALYCLTTRTRCCSTEAGGQHGRWILPDGSNSDDLHFVRGYSSLLLNRRSSAVGPTGVYRCELPDARNVLRNLYIGIYDNPSSGEVNDGMCTIIIIGFLFIRLELMYNSFTHHRCTNCITVL